MPMTTGPRCCTASTSTIEPGEIFGFLGHNGAGKTTAINILTTLIVPTSGSATVCGYDVVARAPRGHPLHRLPAGRCPAVRAHDRRGEPRVLRQALRRRPTPREAVAETLDYLECAELADGRVGSFSTGMRQRIGIAQAIVHDPEVLFLDEPTAGLDPLGVRQLRETILRLNRELGMTVFMNTHLLSEVAKVCTTIGVLNHGELIYKDSIEATTRRFPDEASLEDIYVRMEAAPT